MASPATMDSRSVMSHNFGGYNIRKFRRKHQKRWLFLPRDHSTGRHSVILYRMLHWTCCLAAEGPEGAQRVGRHLSKRHVLDIGIVFSSGDRNPDALRVKNLRTRRCSFRFVPISGGRTKEVALCTVGSDDRARGFPRARQRTSHRL